MKFSLKNLLTKKGRKEGKKLLEPLIGDASKRRYFRIKGQKDNKNLLLMDCEAELETLPKFVEIAGILKNIGINTPHIFNANNETGLAVIEDFGDSGFGAMIDDKALNLDSEDIYRLAVDVLIKIHKDFSYDKEKHTNLPHYDAKLFSSQSGLITNTLIPALTGKVPPKEDICEYILLWHNILEELPLKKQSLLLRDYHADNLIYIKNAKGIKKCGVIDFQDAGIGSCCYDLVSLLQDARRDVPSAIEDKMLEYYLEHFPEINKENFYQEYRIIAAQRHARILAVFTRLSTKMGKTEYQKFMPRVWKQFNNAIEEPKLEPIKIWLYTWLGKENFGKPIS